MAKIKSLPFEQLCKEYAYWRNSPDYNEEYKWEFKEEYGQVFASVSNSQHFKQQYLKLLSYSDNLLPYVLLHGRKNARELFLKYPEIHIKLFQELFNENLPLADRINHFAQELDSLREKEGYKYKINYSVPVFFLFVYDHTKYPLASVNGFIKDYFEYMDVEEAKKLRGLDLYLFYRDYIRETLLPLLQKHLHKDCSTIDAQDFFWFVANWICDGYRAGKSPRQSDFAPRVIKATKEDRIPSVEYAEDMHEKGMRMFTVITENDTSSWDDKTGELYHFPSRYLKFLQPGTKVIYYKGILRDRSFRDTRLSDQPHYFGFAEIGSVYKDTKSTKNDYFATITNFVKFNKPVYIKDEQGKTLETIPPSREINYWRDGVRRIDESVYNKIISLSDCSLASVEHQLNDDQQDMFTTTYVEGAGKKVYTTTYERSPQLKAQALRIHGYTCMACGFNFEKAYGEYGKGYIHVHHVKPVATAGVREVNPKEDLIVLCANCHAMVHRRKNKVLSLEELKALIHHQ